MAKEIAEEYTSSLADLTLNSKPLINMLTMLADENIAHAEAIVEAVEKHLEKVRSEHKLPVLYLIDSIVKNVGNAYVTLFTHNIVNTFCSVFEKVDEKIRAQMFKLRQTWNDVFPAKKLYALDIRVQCIDPAWPITAPAPTHNIHVNPKFFNNPASTTTVTTPTSPVSLDPATLDMQAQLINKHKELLELRQKKLELELLQAKAKLEEQQKQLQSAKILTKSEVPKSVAISAAKPDDSKIPVKVASQVVAPVNKSSAPVTTNSTGGPRINPVSSAMMASVRPMLRDPRLLRQQPTAPVPANLVSSVAVPASQLPTSITSNNFENVNIDDKHKVKSKSHITINFDCASNDKTSVNKAGAQSNTLTRKDPRLISNKVPGSAAGNKNKSNNGRSVSNERSPTKTKTTSAPSRKSSKSSSSSRSFKSSGPEHKVAVSSNNSNDGGASSSISSKNVKDTISSKGSTESSTKSSPSSPNKYKKKTEHSSPRSDKSAADQKRSKTSTSKSESKSSRSRERLPGDKFDDENGRTASPVPVVAAAAPEQRTFKGLKGSAKNRNYMRRNRDVSVSPEPNKDVDLRLGAPPEKQARYQSPATEASEEVVKSTTVDDNPSNKDVDLRTLVVPAAVNKKRSSTEKLEASNAKKSKSQIFDVLFGNEDVDLRQLAPVINTTTAAPVSTQATVVRPPTPPPPIISTVSSEKQETKTKDSKSSLDAIRAKLANATKKSFNNEIRKNSEDTDMRLKQSVFSTDSAKDALQKIIISQADEQLIKNGNLSQALVEKVLTLFETQKLQEAQRRDSEEVKHNDLVNTTLTPISDDELSVDFSHSDSEDDSKTTRKSDVFTESEDRVPPPAPVISQNANSKESLSDQSKEQNKTHPIGDPRLPTSTRLGQQNQEPTNTAWHGHHRRRRTKTHWGSPPPQHPGPEPWLRPPPAVLTQSMYGARRQFPPFIRPPGENFAPRMDAALPVVPPHILESTRTSSPPTIGSQNTKELPLADPLVLEYIEQDTMRTINIDGRPREIRYYDETAVVIMSWDDPREISFQNGTRLVTFDDKESFTLSFNDTYRDVTIGGKPHRLRLGTPTRELYIDGKWYECFFGGPGIGIEVDGQMHVVKMDGPPPHVKIGTVKRNDLVAGKINLIINARTMVPVFLDAKPQKFDIEGKIHTLRFVDALRTVLINEVPFKVEFGGLPKPITVHDKKHFIRFSVLPRGIKPGYVNISNMEGHRFPSPPRNDKDNSNDATGVENITNVSVNEPALPMFGKRRIRPADHENSPDSSSRNSPIMQNSLQHLGSLDVLSSIITSPMANSSNVTGYQVDSTQDSQDGFPCNVSKSNEIPGLSTTENTAPVNAFLPSSLNINELFQKLVATGIVTAAKDKTPPPAPRPREEPESFIKPVLFAHPETLKIRQAPLITALFSGMQCSSCGVRFPPEHSMQYSQHLDWHFRQNRRGRNSARKALCRKWYYDVTDWKNFEEIEDIEEREKNWFESQQQQQQAEGGGEDGDEEIEIPSVPADSNSQETRCEVCHDKFEQFYNEEKEEWHLRMAIREDGKTYHPLCYDDYKASLANLTFEDTFHNTTVENNEVRKEEDLDLKDKETSEPKEEETDAKNNPEIEDKPESVKAEEEDDDVIIQEPKVEQIEIDDAVGDENELNLQTESNDGTKTEDDDIVLPGNIRIKEEPMDDMFCIGNIKTEPLDNEMEVIRSVISADTTHAELVSSIDGNVQCSAPTITPTTGMGGKIKITITKPMLAPKEPAAPAPAPPPEQEPLPDAVVASNEPLPPGEEPVQLNLKPALQGLTLTKQPPVSKGTELTGLCSIM